MMVTNTNLTKESSATGGDYTDDEGCNFEEDSQMHSNISS